MSAFRFVAVLSFSVRSWIRIRVEVRVAVRLGAPVRVEVHLGASVRVKIHAVSEMGFDDLVCG